MHNALALPGHEGTIRGAPHSAPAGGQVERWVLVATILGSSMAFIDGSVVNVALPCCSASSGPAPPTRSGWWRPTRCSWPP